MLVNDEPIIPDEGVEVTETEETNQVETVEVEKEESQVEKNEVKEEPKEDAKVDEPKQTLKVKFLGEEKEIPMEEVQKYTQIGMNEERLSNKYKTQLDELAETRRVISELAKLNGISEADAVKSIANNIEQAKLEQIKGNVDIPDDVAKELLEYQKLKEQVANKEKEAEGQKEFTDFIKEYPDVKAEDIPDEVWNIQKQGVPLKYAYQSYLLNQIQTENKILKQNASNSERANIPSTTENVGKTEVADD